MIPGSTQDPQTVTSAGEKVTPLIDGVLQRKSVVHTDGRGELGEIYDPRWGLIDDPLVYAYYSMIRPGAVKGWVYHRLQSDRFYVISGFLKVVLFDPRAGSPTKGMINELFITERDRSLLVIPPLVVHAVENIGTIDCFQLNLPTVAYNHVTPDKYRVPPDAVPYQFGRKAG